MRRALEKLGPAFIKLGQAAASREDVLSPEVAQELRKLCDQVVPIPLADAQRLLDEELGPRAPRLEGDAVAAASLGQVYRIKIGGEQIAMKIQRPGLADKLSVDVVILLKSAAVGRRIYSWLSVSTLDFVEVARAWAQMLWHELDYEREARSMDYMRDRLVGHVPGLVIPSVYWPLSGMRVLSTQWIDGERITDIRTGLAPRHIAIGVDAFATMVLDVGFVHADPHAGNVLITDNGDVCLLDFGMVLEVPQSHRMAWAKALYSLVRKDHSKTLDHLIEIGFFPADCPRDEILSVMPKVWAELVDCGSDIKKRKQAVKDCFGELLIMARTFEFSMPDYYLALARAMITLEGIAIAADVDFDIFVAAMPLVMRFLAKQGKQEAISFGRRSCSRLSSALCCKRLNRQPLHDANTCYKFGLLVGVVSLGVMAVQSQA